MRLIVALGLILLASGLASGYVSENTQIPNNPITITGCTNPTVQELQQVYIDFGHTDADSDAGAYTTNATKGSLNPTTGVYSWTTTATDSGVYVWSFNVSDGWGSADGCVVTVTVTNYANVPDITNPYPDTPYVTSDSSPAFGIGGNISMTTHNHWEINTGAGYTHLEWDNSTTTPEYTFSPAAKGEGDYLVRLTSQDPSDPAFNSQYVWTIHIGGNWTTKNIMLTPYFEVTVIAKDSLSYAVIDSFTATLNMVERSTENGSVVYSNMSYGKYSLEVSATGHASKTTSVLVSGNDEIEVYLVSTTGTTPDADSSHYQYTMHYVRFVVCNVWGTRYEGVDVVASYMDGNMSMEKSAITGSDGAVGFNMSQNIRYTIVCTDAEQGINETLTLYPVDNEYFVIVGSTSPWTDYEHRPCDNIHIDVSKEIIDGTHAYINVTYLDDLNMTTELKMWINITNTSDPRNQTVIATWTAPPLTNSVTHSFIVEDYAGNDYHVRVWHEHDEFGTIYDKVVSFWGMLVDLGLPVMSYTYISIIILLFVGAMFGATTAPTGSVVVCATGWVLLAFGWMWYFSIFAPISLTMASIYAITTVLNDRNRKAGYA